MCISNSLAISISPQQITLGFNIALGVIVAIVILGGIIGLLRGIWNTSFRFVFVSILVIISFVFCKQIANAVATIDLSGISNNATFVIGNETIHLTTIKETVFNAIKAYFSTQEQFASTLSNPSTIELIENITMMLIRFVTMIILGILVLVVGDLILAPILYHLLFKMFIPKKARKKIKLRIAGFFLGATKSAIVMTLILTPFTATLNAINQSRKENSNNNAVIDNELYNQIMSWINAYDESYFAKVLFNWTSDKNGNTFDMTLLDNATSDKGFSYINELNALSDVAFTVLNSGAISVDGNTTIIDLSILLNNTIVSTLIAQFSASEVVLSVLPIAATLALNVDIVKEYIDSEKINLDEIDWKEELETIDGIYSAIYESGAVDEALKNPKDIVPSLFENNRKDKIKQALNSIDDSKILSQILPAVVYKMANLEDEDGNPSTLSNYFSTDWEDYVGFSFGSELAIIYDSVYEINKVTDYRLIRSFIDNEEPNQDEEPLQIFQGTGFVEKSHLLKSEAENKSNPLDLILENAEEIIPFVVGKLDGNGNPITDENGISLQEDGVCLLDSKFLYNSIDKLLTSTINLIFASLQNIDTNNIDIPNILNKLTSLQDYKKEVGVLLNCSSDIMKDDNLNTIITGENQLDIGKSEVRQSLKNILQKLDMSLILNEILPEIVKVSVEQMNGVLEPYNLSSSDFNYEVDNFCSELSFLLDVFEPLENIDAAVSNENTSDVINNLNPQDIESVLNVFHDSKILNPYENQNFYKIIDYIFSVDGLGIENITSRVDDIENIRFVTSDGVYGENYYISQFFANLKNDSIISLISDSNAPIHDSSVFDTTSIESLFEAVDKSEIISKSFGSLLDRTILPLLEITTSDMTFTNVMDWKAEGRNLKAVLDGLQNINKSFEKINWINENPTYVNDILSNFSNSQAFREDQFSIFVFEKMKVQLEDYLKDYPSKNEPTYNSSRNDFENIDNWPSEIYNITNLIATIQSLADENSSQKGSDGLNIISNNSDQLSSNQIEDVLNAVNECDSMRMVFVNAIDSIVSSDSLKVSTLTLEDCNVGQLLRMDKMERAKEIQAFVSIDRSIKNMELDKGISLETLNGSDISILLEATHNSRVFNTLKDYSKTLTVYEQIIKTIVKESNFEDKILNEGETLDSRILSINNNYASTINVKDEWIGDGEISRIADIITSYKDTGVKNFDFNEEMVAKLTENDEQIDKMNNLLKSINNSELFYRAIPNILDDALDNNLIQAEGLEVNLMLINADYNQGSRYEEIEIDKLTGTLKNLNKFNNMKDEDGNLIKEPQFKDYDLDLLEELLNNIHNSKILNTLKNNNDQTFFENIVGSLVKKGHIDEKMVKENLTLVDIIKKVENNYGNEDIDDEWINENGEIKKITTLFRNFQNLGLSNADITEIDDISSEQLRTTLSSLNDSEVCYRALPSYIEDLLNEESISDIDLSATNARYAGDNRYDEEEIYVLSELYNEISDIDSLFQKTDNLTTLDEVAIERIESLLIKLSSSQIFHNAGSKIPTLDTVFEQVMMKLLIDSSIDRTLYDSSMYVEDVNMTSKEKAHLKVVTYQEPWDSEIVRICDAIRVVKESFPNLERIDSLDLSHITPEKIRNILKTVNESDILFDSVPIYVKQLFNTVNLDSLSENKENYLIGREVYELSELDYLYELLNKIKNENNSYQNFENFDIIDFIENGKSISPIMIYLDSSSIFKDINGLVFFNAIDTAGYGVYVREDYHNGDYNVFTKLFTMLNSEQIAKEGEALDKFVVTLNGIRTIDFDTNDFDTSIIEELFSLSYDGDTKNMFVCELLGKFLEIKFEQSNLLQDGITLEWFKENEKDFVYPLFNEVEKNGLKGALDIKKIANIDINNIQILSIDYFDNCFSLLESNGVKSKIAMSIYQKGFYVPFTNSIKIIDDNKDLYFGSNIETKELFTNNYSTLKNNPYDDTFTFYDENIKIKNILTAIKSVG